MVIGGMAMPLAVKVGFTAVGHGHGQEIGDAKIELDELIDINLADLAKEYCVCLTRSHVLAQIT